ncbi:hypothetical protein L3i22_020320 [Actinoplanes sp. L3-i22]|nr:hypothetical protein L3i22_020320 [Actinoplanes sp. L3-i22]
MRGLLRTGLIGLVVLSSVTVADEVRAVTRPEPGVSISRLWNPPKLG